MFMDTPEFLTTCLHTITVIALPLHILGTYCIIFQTPKTMSSVKWAMLTFHFLCMTLDWSLTILTIPFLTYPGMAGIPLGLLTDFGVGVEYQIFFIVVMISEVYASIVLIFENRYYIMFGKETKWRHFRGLFAVWNYSFALTFFIPALYNVPEDQKAALEELRKLVPELPKTIGGREIFVAATEFRWIVIPITVFVLVLGFELYFILTLISRNMKNSMRLSTLSTSTLRLQKKFLHAMYIQAGVFLLNIQGPVVYGLISQFTGYYNQAFNNLSFILISLHGVNSTAVMIYVHKPYREFCAELIGMAKRRLPRNTVVVSVMIASNVS